MECFKSSKAKLPGTSFVDVRKKAEVTYRLIKSRTKRTPYIKSKYFRGEKVFLTLFWAHLFEKHEKDRVRRLKYFDCALDLIRNTMLNPETKDNFQMKNELLHRFYGTTKNGEEFIV